MLTQLLALFQLASSGVNPRMAVPDTPWRFHGVARLLINSTEKLPVCRWAAFRSEDLTTKEYANRFHVLIQTDLACFLPEYEAKEWVKVSADPNGNMVISTDGLGEITCTPMDKLIRDVMVQSSHASNGGFEVRLQTISLKRLDQGLYELLIVEPL